MEYQLVMQRGMGVAGNGVGLLNGQTRFHSFGGRGGGSVVYKQGFRI
jgi:hypothetical protein